MKRLEEPSREGFSVFATLICWACSSMMPLNAQILEQLHAFVCPPYWYESSLVQGSDGCLYGTSSSGGSNNLGAVFKITPGGSLTTLACFNGTNGFLPSSRLVEASDGNFYGTTYGGGISWSPGPTPSNGFGTVFKLSRSGILSTVAYFGDYGSNPRGGLIQASDGNLYGTTTGNSGTDYGSVYRIALNGAVSTLAFFNVDNGANPYCDLVQGKDGWLYGTTYGPYAPFASIGNVFKVSLSGSLTNVYSFGHSSGISLMAGLVQGSDGNFYGTGLGGQPCGDGLVFKMTPDGNLTSLVTFCGNNGNGPRAPLVQGADGSFYGTTERGGTYNLGTVFRVTSTGSLKTLVSFDGTNGSLPHAGLTIAQDGNFYGTSSGSGAAVGFGFGTIFRMTSDGVLTTLFPYTNSEGCFPQARLVEGFDGNLYGTTYQGGAGGAGTVFKMSRAGALTTLAQFYGGNGSFPTAGLIQLSDGNFFGTTSEGPSNQFGTVFKMTPDGNLTSLVFFNGTNGWGPSGLVRGTNFSLYGTTYFGGPTFSGINGDNGYGTVFQVSPSGALTTLNSSYGANQPHTGLLQAMDGYLYGTTSGYQGPASGGTVFRIGFDRALTTIASLIWSNNGAEPYGDLVQGSDGSLYGTTSSGGHPYYGGFGTVFKVTPAGDLTTMVTFNGREQGGNPRAGLIQASDGNFYGTTSQGGYPGGCGTVFRMTPSGALTTLISFEGTDGAHPGASLIQASDGNLYGTAASGGPYGGGIIFRLNFALRFTSIETSAGSVVLRWTAIPGRTYQLQAKADLSTASWTDVGPSIMAVGTNLSITNPITAPVRFYRVALAP